MKKQSRLAQEIGEQPAVLAEFLAAEQAPMARLAAAMRQRGVTLVVIAARGTSDNAGRYAQYLLGARNRLVVALATPSLFTIYQQPPQFGPALVLGISQSGQSPDIVAVLAEARRQGCLTAAFTNAPDSPLAAEADHVIPLHAGPEQAVAATKSYTAELAAIALLSAQLAEDAGMLAALQQLPAAVAKTLTLDPEIAGIAPRYRYMTRSVVIGRGYNYATAFEMALKLKELTYTTVEPYSSADFLHGPLAMLEQGFPLFTVAPTGLMTAEMSAFLRTVNQHGAETLVISDVPALLAQAHTPLRLPQPVPEWLSPITSIVPGQLLALHLAAERGLDVDRPRSIRKVTETK